MAEAVVEKPVCENCDAEVRKGTAFCYSCGKAVAADTATEPVTETSVNGADDKAAKRTRAATERRKARVSPRKTIEYTWQPVDDVRLPLVISIIIAGMVLVVTFLLVFWK